MNLNPISEVDFLCYGEVVLMPDGYFAAYDAIEKGKNDGQIEGQDDHLVGTVE